MDGYSEIDAVYFSVANKTSYAKYVPKLISELSSQVNMAKVIETGTYEGFPPYKPIDGKVPTLLKQYHSAEHQVYNSFMKNIKNLDADTQLAEFQKYIPKLEEAKIANSFSIFCGTTVFISSAILLIASAVPYYFKLSGNIVFMLPWLAFIIAATFIISIFIQKKFYLAQASDEQLILAIEALKEVLKNERNPSK